MGTLSPGYGLGCFKGHLRDKSFSNPNSDFILEYRVRIPGRTFKCLSISALREICKPRIILEAEAEELENGDRDTLQYCFHVFPVPIFLIR